jgi:hypothetical protein
VQLIAGPIPAADTGYPVADSAIDGFSSWGNAYLNTADDVGTLLESGAGLLDTLGDATMGVDGVGAIPKSVAAGLKLVAGGLKLSSKVSKASALSKTFDKIVCSFDGSTPVETDMGPLAIADVTPGMRVLARNEQTGAETYWSVLQTLQEHHTERLVLIVEAGGTIDRLIATPNHLFFVWDSGWKSAVDLRSGDILIEFGGGTAHVRSVELVKKPFLAYNLEVAEDHTFFVGRTGLWVHNACGPPVQRNKHLAGKAHPRTGVPFDKDGYPDFSNYSKSTVEIQQTGNYAADFKKANAAAGFDTTPEGYTWHHHQNGRTMQLVPKDVHRMTAHTGGRALTAWERMERAREENH